MTLKPARETMLAIIIAAALCAAGCADKKTVAPPIKQPTTLPAETPTTMPLAKPPEPAKPTLVYSLKSGRYFAVSVTQNGKPVAISPKDRTVTLKKAPFALIFSFMGTGPGFVAANVSFDPTSYKMVLNGKDINEVPGFEGTGMAEWDRNRDRDFFVNPDCFHYWHYDDPTENRFDKIAPGEDRIVCTRTIKQYRARGADDKLKLTEPISKIEGKALYFVFARFRREETDHKTGLQLECLNIRWR